jgi:hypothetical protein
MKHSNAGVRYDVDGSIIRSGLQDKKVWNLREIVRACNVMAVRLRLSFLTFRVSSCRTLS